MKEHPGTFTAGVLFIAIGVVYLLQALDVWQVRPGRLWPLAVIAVGVVILFNGTRRSSAQSAPDQPPTPEEPTP